MKVSIISLFIATLGILTVSEASSAEYMYKWKTDDGEIHYSERPPNGVPFTKIRVQKNKDNGSPSASPDIKEKDTGTAAKKSPEDDNYAEWRNENCRIAQQNLDILQNSNRIAKEDGDLMSDEEKAESIAKMTQQRDKYCAEGKEEN